MALAVICSACSLDEKMTSYATSSSYYTSVTKIRTGLNGCYNPIRATLNGTGFWEMCECATDMMELIGQNVQKTSHLLRDLVAAKRATAHDIKVKGKGTQKGYTKFIED